MHVRNPNARVPTSSDFFTCSGDLMKPVLSGKLMPDGTIKLTEVDQIDIKAEINSHHGKIRSRSTHSRGKEEQTEDAYLQS